MPELIQIAPTHSSVHVRPVLESFDSGEECSLQHWMDVCKLVDEDDSSSVLDDTEVFADTVPATWN